jgi:hypothetical protein
VLCGALSYSATYKGEALTGDPLSYNASSREFTAESTNLDLIGTAEDYAVTAVFAQYSAYTSVTGQSVINFDDACETPTFTTSTQINPAANEYDG